MKKILGLLLCVFIIVGCSSSNEKTSDKVIIYTNADEEAVLIMQETLDDNGFTGQYQIESYGSSELAGKLEAEGKDTKADVLAFSTFHLESLQEKNSLFIEHGVDTSGLLEQYQSTEYLPFLVNTGSLFYNVDRLNELGLKAPTSIKDLADPAYKNQISFPNLAESTTGWLMVQAIINEYGLEEGKEIIEDIKTNAGVHIESSGSGPIKKVDAGEVAIGFGLRHQAVSFKNDNHPIEIVDPKEGNFTLTESLAVINKEGKAKEMASVLFEKAHDKMIIEYPSKLFTSDDIDDSEMNVKSFSEVLTKELLAEHIAWFDK